MRQSLKPLPRLVIKDYSASPLMVKAGDRTNNDIWLARMRILTQICLRRLENLARSTDFRTWF